MENFLLFALGASDLPKHFSRVCGAACAASACGTQQGLLAVLFTAPGRRTAPVV
jgi:hypothetical protein